MNCPICNKESKQLIEPKITLSGYTFLGICMLKGIVIKLKNAWLCEPCSIIFTTDKVKT